MPPVGPVIFVPNHTNALVDPLLLMISMRRELTVTAKNVLGNNPFLRWLMAALGVVTFHRREDVGKGADLRQNVHSLQLCRHILADGGAICVFPEGVSHSNPKLRSFHVGPARMALDFLRKEGNPGRLRIVPVGLLYTEKDRFRSGVWLRFGTPVDVARWVGEHPHASPAELTEVLERRVTALTLNYETRRESAILSWAAEIVATGARNPAPLGAAERPVADWFRLLGRLQAGYQTLLRTDPQAVEELTTRIRRYRVELKRAGISPGEVYLPIHFGRAALFVVRELELAVVGAPIALFGAVNHVLAYWIVKSLARKMSTDKDHWASNVVYPSFLVFPFFYLLQLTAAWLLFPALWAGIYTVALPYAGYYSLLYGDRLGQTWRRAATFLRFLFQRHEQQRLATEGEAIVARIREFGARLETEKCVGEEAVASGTTPLFAMSASDLETQFHEDIATVREAFAGLDRLEGAWHETRQTIQARKRGYFTPEEDDRVRQLLLAYRNYRLVLYEIINRYLDHEQFAEPVDQLRGFMIAYSAGLTLYVKTMRLVQAYEHEPLIRAKLNEPDVKFGLEGGFFEEILRAYTSLVNYRLLAGCGVSWLRHRRAARRAGLDKDPDWAWLAEVIRRQRPAVRKTFWYLLRHRLCYDWRMLGRLLHRPVHRTRYSLRAFVGATFAQRHTTPWYEPSIRPEVLAQLRSQLQTGDVLLVRAEQKFTTALLPGFWSHSAMYVGDRRDLDQMSVCKDAAVRKHWDAMPADGAPFGYVIEAISPGVLISPLEKCLHADHVAVLRPNVSDADRRAAVIEAFSHVGKPYDFEFDFNVTTRLVCTQVIYRAYHGRGTIEFPLVKRLGRYTLSCDDIMRLFLERSEIAEGASFAPFRVVALVLQSADGQARFVAPKAALDVLRAIRDGVGPGKLLHPQLGIT